MDASRLYHEHRDMARVAFRCLAGRSEDWSPSIRAIRRASELRLIARTPHLVRPPQTRPAPPLCTKSIRRTPQRPAPARRVLRAPASRCSSTVTTTSSSAPSPPARLLVRPWRTTSRPGECTGREASQTPSVTTGRSTISRPCNYLRADDADCRLRSHHPIKPRPEGSSAVARAASHCSS